jgi:hypothetical protein
MTSTLPRRHTLLAAVVALVACGLTAGSSYAASAVRLTDLDGRAIDPFVPFASSPTTKAIVFVFVSVDCPISNRYSPEIQRLERRFVDRGVAFRLVYPNPAESPSTIRAHLADYRYTTVPALRDTHQALVKIAKATITPEAAVFDRRGILVYHGRIDDKYVSLGVERPTATRHDLEDALTTMLAGKPVQPSTAPAVGCYIADFTR